MAGETIYNSRPGQQVPGTSNARGAQVRKLMSNLQQVNRQTLEELNALVDKEVADVGDKAALVTALGDSAQSVVDVAKAACDCIDAYPLVDPQGNAIAGVVPGLLAADLV